MDAKKSKELFMYYHLRNMMICDKDGNRKVRTIKRFEPMRLSPGGELVDVMAIVDEKKELAFSFNQCLSGHSWVDSIRVLNTKNTRSDFSLPFGVKNPMSKKDFKTAGLLLGQLLSRIAIA